MSSEVLLDSEVAGEEFIVVRRKDSANNFGEDVQQTLRFPAVGSVTPLGANSLLRQEAFQTEEKTIRVTTDFHLRTASKDETGQGLSAGHRDLEWRCLFGARHQ